MNLEVKLTAGEALKIYINRQFFGTYTFRYTDEDDNPVFVNYPCNFESFENEINIDITRSLHLTNAKNEKLQVGDLIYIEKESGEGFTTFILYFLEQEGGICIPKIA